MNEPIRSAAASGIFAVLLLLVFLFRLPDQVTVFLILATWFYHAYLFTPSLSPDRSKTLGFFLAWFAILALQCVWLTIWYYIGRTIDVYASALCLIPTLFVLWCGTRIKPLRVHEQKTEEPASQKEKKWITLIACIGVLACAAFVIWSAQHARTTDAIRTPWPLLASGTLLALGLGWGGIFWLARQRPSSFFPLFLSFLLAGSFASIASIVYQLGFGFDGFLHRASENILLQTGTLLPHPWYYIGQYTFVVLITKLFSLPVVVVDTWLVPILGALLIPAFFLAFRAHKTLATVLAMLLLPWSTLTSTTPQSFAYLLGMFALVFALPSQRLHPLLPLSIGLWSLATHPLAGAPFLAAVLALILIRAREETNKSPLKSPLIWTVFLGGIFAVPFAFFFLGQRGQPILWHPETLFSLSTYTEALTALTPPLTRLSLWPDWSIFIGYITPFATLLLALCACVFQKNQRASWILLTCFGVGMSLIGFALKNIGDFTFLIDYERSNYADRFFILAEWFLLLPAASMLTQTITRDREISKTKILILAVFLSAAFSANAYLSLPRHDATLVGHSWSVGRADLATVRWIERDANGEPYTVLANQSTSAAAVSLLGFKRYANNCQPPTANCQPIFYYPLPTGGPLYQLYLDLTQKTPTLETIQKARVLGESRVVYVVLNDYWWGAPKTAPLLEALADHTEAIENGKIFVYRFDPSTPIKR